MMNEKNIELGKSAYYNYIEKEENIENEIIKYIGERIKANEQEIGRLVEITKEKINIKKIEKVLKKESRYKVNKAIVMDSNNFISGTLITPKGLILKEESNVEKVVEIYIDSILSRNAIVVSDMEYSEISVKRLILEIIQIALEKFGVDKNLIQLVPYEEVNEEEFNMYVETKEIYIYLEDEEFREEVENEKYLITGEIDTVIDKINSHGICECAVIYTKDREKAYKFINGVNGKNVFVNTKIANKKEEIKIDDWYIDKRIIYPGM